MIVMWNGENEIQTHYIEDKRRYRKTMTHSKYIYISPNKQDKNLT